MRRLVREIYDVVLGQADWWDCPKCLIFAGELLSLLLLSRPIDIKEAATLPLASLREWTGQGEMERIYTAKVPIAILINLLAATVADWWLQRGERGDWPLRKNYWKYRVWQIETECKYVINVLQNVDASQTIPTHLLLLQIRPSQA